MSCYFATDCSYASIYTSTVGNQGAISFKLIFCCYLHMRVWINFAVNHQLWDAWILAMDLLGNLYKSICQIKERNQCTQDIYKRQNKEKVETNKKRKLKQFFFWLGNWCMMADVFWTEGKQRFRLKWCSI